jgi:hypothetical protein
MMTTLMTILGFVLGVVAFYLHRAYLLHISYIEGRRSGLKDAIKLARERGDVALYLAPAGEMRTGLIRAQIAHNIELELCTLLKDVR